jgi:hypothetical protein
LARTYAPEDTVIIKVNDRCNSLGEVLLEQDSRSKIIFIAIELKTFIVSTLKSEVRRNWLRTRLYDAERDAAAFPALAPINVGKLSDAHAAAFLWSLNSSICRRLRTRNPARVHIVDGEQIPGNAEAIVRQCLIDFNIPFEEQQLTWTVNHAAASKYSKDPSRPYDGESRRRDLLDAEQRIGEELEEGTRWFAANFSDETKFGRFSEERM